MVTFKETEKAVTDQDISRLESLVGLAFPEPYKEHLLKFNGRYCEPADFTFMEQGKSSNSTIDWFLAIYDGKHNNLEDYIKTYKLDEKRMPKHMLPIGDDPFGNLICISCGKSDYGHVYF